MLSALMVTLLLRLLSQETLRALAGKQGCLCLQVQAKYTANKEAFAERARAYYLANKAAYAERARKHRDKKREAQQCPA